MDHQFRNKAEAQQAIIATERRAMSLDRAASIFCGDAASQKRRASLECLFEAARIRALLPTLPD